MAKRSPAEYMRADQAAQPTYGLLDDVVFPSIRHARAVIDLLANVDEQATFPGTLKAAARLAVQELLAAEEALGRFEEWRRKEWEARTPGKSVVEFARAAPTGKPEAAA